MVILCRWGRCDTVRTELSLWPSVCCICCRWVNQFDAWTQLIAKIMWGKVGWEWGKDCHVVLLHMVMNCVHSSESEITNCQLTWQFLLYSGAISMKELWSSHTATWTCTVVTNSWSNKLLFKFKLEHTVWIQRHSYIVCITVSYC